MIGAQQLRAMVARLPETSDESQLGRFAFSVAGKGFAWTYLERIAPRKARQPRPDVLAIRCSLEQKETLIEAAPEIYFDDDHYRGFPAVLVRLDKIPKPELELRLKAGWALKAPKHLLTPTRERSRINRQRKTARRKPDRG